MSSVPPQKPFKEPRQQRKAGRRYDLGLGCLLATVLQQFRSLFSERVHSGQREPFLLDDGLTKAIGQSSCKGTG